MLTTTLLQELADLMADDPAFDDCELTDGELVVQYEGKLFAVAVEPL